MSKGPATVGVFTGIFAKEAVVGTLDVLYQDVAGEKIEEEVSIDIAVSIKQAFVSIGTNLMDLSHSLADPLGLGSIGDSAEEQGVSNTGLAAMQSLFGNRYSAFCYLVLILLYTPCVAVMGALNRESGPLWASLVIAWSSFLAYWAASVLYQLSNLFAQPVFAISWLAGAVVAMFFAVQSLRRLGQRSKIMDSSIIAIG